MKVDQSVRCKTKDAKRLPLSATSIKRRKSDEIQAAYCTTYSSLCSVNIPSLQRLKAVFVSVYVFVCVAPNSTMC